MRTSRTTAHSSNLSWVSTLGETTWICTYKCALRVWPDLVSHSNQALRYTLGLINPHGIDRKTLNPHRALSDVIVTSAIFERATQTGKVERPRAVER